MMFRRLSARLIDTAETLAMWYRRRLMTRDAHTTPMDEPM